MKVTALESYRKWESSVLHDVSVHDTLKSLSKAIVTERERLKHAVEQEQDAKNQTLTPNAAYVQSLRAALAEVRKASHRLVRTLSVH